VALLYIKACGTGVDGLLQQCADHAVFIEVPETYMRLRTRPRVEDEAAHIIGSSEMVMTITLPGGVAFH
jgi:hypothetical protein